MPVNTVSWNDYHQTGKPKRSTWRCHALQREPILSTLQPGKAVAVDCEGIELLKNEKGDTLFSTDKKGLGQVSVVDEDGNVLYDTFVYYPKGSSFKMHPKHLNLGVKWGDVQPENGAQPLDKVLKDVKAIFDISGMIITHARENEEDYLRGIAFSAYEVRDTQKASAYQKYAKQADKGPALRDLSREVLKKSIQKKAHSSVEDSKATMELYKLDRDAMDREQCRANSARFNMDVPEWWDENDLLDFLIAAGAGSSNNSDTSTDEASTGSSNITATTMSSVATNSIRYEPALPDLPELRRGKVFDKRTSRYV